MSSRRTRHVAKWSVTLACLMLGALCLITKIVGLEYYSDGQVHYISISNGAILFEQVGGGGRWDIRGSRLRPRWDLYFPYTWWPRVYKAGTGPFHYCDLEVVVPLWMVAVLLAIPAALLWWRDRPPPTGHCRNCGYDLTGNISGRCPECGEPTPAARPLS